MESPTTAWDGTGTAEDTTDTERVVRTVKRKEPEVARLAAACPVEMRQGINQRLVHRVAGRPSVRRDVDFVGRHPSLFDSLRAFTPEAEGSTLGVGLYGLFELEDDDGKQLKNKKGEPIILRKTLQLTYHTNGDEVYPGEDVVGEGEGRIGKNPKVWVMR